MPHWRPAVQHHPGAKIPFSLRAAIPPIFNPTTAQKKPGGGEGEMETITILTYQPLIDLEVSTPSRCSPPSAPQLHAPQGLPPAVKHACMPLHADAHVAALILLFQLIVRQAIATCSFAARQRHLKLDHKWLLILRLQLQVFTAGSIARGLRVQLLQSHCRHCRRTFGGGSMQSMRACTSHCRISFARCQHTFVVVTNAHVDSSDHKRNDKPVRAMQILMFLRAHTGMLK